jgi:putative endonuclease
MPFHTYVLRSASSGKYYVGHTENLSQRILEHNSNRAPSTKNRGPWELVHSEEFSTRSEASRRERQIKGMKSRAWIEQLASVMSLKYLDI